MAVGLHPEMVLALERVRSYRYVAGAESDLQEQLATAMTREGVHFQREYDLGGGRGRIDFYLPAWNTGLEVKVDGSAAAVLRQLHRYSGAALDALVLITRRARQGGLPDAIGTMPLHVLVLWEGAL